MEQTYSTENNRNDESMNINTEDTVTISNRNPINGNIPHSSSTHNDNEQHRNETNPYLNNLNTHRNREYTITNSLNNNFTISDSNSNSVTYESVNNEINRSDNSSINRPPITRTHTFLSSIRNANNNNIRITHNISHNINSSNSTNDTRGERNISIRQRPLSAFFSPNFNEITESNNYDMNQINANNVITSNSTNNNADSTTNNTGNFIITMPQIPYPNRFTRRIYRNDRRDLSSIPLQYRRRTPIRVNHSGNVNNNNRQNTINNNNTNQNSNANPSTNPTINNTTINNTNNSNQDQSRRFIYQSFRDRIESQRSNRGAIRTFLNNYTNVSLEISTIYTRLINILFNKSSYYFSSIILILLLPIIYMSFPDIQNIKISELYENTGFKSIVPITFFLSILTWNSILLFKHLILSFETTEIPEEPISIVSIDCVAFNPVLFIGFLKSINLEFVKFPIDKLFWFYISIIFDFIFIFSKHCLNFATHISAKTQLETKIRTKMNRIMTFNLYLIILNIFYLAFLLNNIFENTPMIICEIIIFKVILLLFHQVKHLLMIKDLSNTLLGNYLIDEEKFFSFKRFNTIIAILTHTIGVYFLFNMILINETDTLSYSGIGYYIIIIARLAYDISVETFKFLKRRKLFLEINEV